MSEEIDVLDEEGKIAGRVSREEAHEKGLRHRTVVLLLFDLKGNVFLQKRASWKKYFGGRWEFSAGGHLEAGEGEEEGIRKEAGEEIGVGKLELEKIGEEEVDVRIGEIHNREIVSVFKAVSDTGVVIDGEEVEEGEFWEIGDLKKAIKERQEEFTPLLVKCVEKYL